MQRRKVLHHYFSIHIIPPCLKALATHHLKLLEIGTENGNVHFLVQSLPTDSVIKIVTMIKSLTAQEVFKRCPNVKKKLWRGEFWSDGCFASAVGRQGNEDTLATTRRTASPAWQPPH
jgi:putative transposase